MGVLSRKNQVTLPVDARRAAGLEPGDDLRVEVTDRAPRARPCNELVEEFARVFGASVYPERYLDELRREWP